MPICSTIGRLVHPGASGGNEVRATRIRGTPAWGASMERREINEAGSASADDRRAGLHADEGRSDGAHRGEATPSSASQSAPTGTNVKRKVKFRRAPLLFANE